MNDQARVAKRDAERVWQKHDAGAGHRNDNENGDCQIRSLVTARGLTFDAAYDLLYALQGRYRTIGFALHKFLDLEPTTFGVVRKLPFPAKRGQPRMTAKSLAKLHPTGTFILRMSHHVAAMVDGKLLDRWDSSGKCVYTAWEVSSERESA